LRERKSLAKQETTQIALNEIRVIQSVWARAKKKKQKKNNKNVMNRETAFLCREIFY